MESALRGSLPPGLTVIETLRLDPAGPWRVERHLARMTDTCARLGIGFDAAAARARLLSARGAEPRRARLTVDGGGRLTLATEPLDPAAAFWRLAWAAARIRADDPWRRMKTSKREVYDRARASLPRGIDEALVLNDRGRIAEGAITTVFLETPRGLATPPVSAGALPGILRAELIDSGRAFEAELRPEDLRDARIYVGNALRGLIPARIG